MSASFFKLHSRQQTSIYTITAEDLPDSSEDKDNVLRGSMMATLAKKLVINSLSIILLPLQVLLKNRS